MKIAQLDQEDRKNFANYLKRVNKLVYKMTNDNVRINIDMIIIRDIKNQFKRDQINFECNRKIITLIITLIS